MDIIIQGGPGLWHVEEVAEGKNSLKQQPSPREKDKDLIKHKRV